MEFEVLKPVPAPFDKVPDPDPLLSLHLAIDDMASGCKKKLLCAGIVGHEESGAQVVPISDLGVARDRFAWIEFEEEHREDRLQCVERHDLARRRLNVAATMLADVRLR